MFVTICCPRCQFSKTVPREQLPGASKRAKCPRCKHVFLLTTETVRQTAPVVAADRSQVKPAAAEVNGVIPLKFYGTAREYFGIWVVNTLLKILTLGIYSPWAKVRKRRFFYANSKVGGAPFDYLADPRVLLKGWVLGAGLFIIYSLGSSFSPLFGNVAGLLFLLVLPWLVVRSRLFNTRNTSFRNLRFNFKPAYREAYAAYAWLPLLVPLTMGLIVPYMYWRQKKFLVENARFGQTPFSFGATVGDFYVTSLKAFGLMLLVIAASFGAFGFFGGLSVMAAGPSPQAGAFLPFLPFLVALPGYLLIYVYFQTRIFNLTFNAMQLGSHRFVSHLRVRDIFWIFLSNAVAIVASCGLLTPWAAVRLARYRVGHLALNLQGTLDGFLAASTPDVGAAGEEIGDIFDIDIEIAF